MFNLNNVFCTKHRRNVSHTNFNYYKTGEFHPNRILDEHDIFYVLEGGWEVGQDGINYLLEQGDVIILHAGHHHYGVNKCLPGTKTMFIHFECAKEDKLEAEVNEKALPEAFLSIPSVIKCGSSISITSIFEDIIISFWSDLPNKTIKLAALLDVLLFELSTISKRNTDTYDRVVNDILHHIRLSHEKIYTLSELSEKVHVCSRSLTNRFKKITGKTIHQYQINLKLEMACMLINDNPSKTFKELAVNLGFYDEFHFSKLFKKKYGITPYQFKKEKTEKYTPQTFGYQ